MAKTINFSYKGKDYTLEFNRNAIKAMERGGFNINEIGEKPVTVIEALFHGAFKMHHSTVSREKAMEIYETLNHKEKLVESLIALYNSVIESLAGGESDETDEGNANWSAT